MVLNINISLPEKDSAEEDILPVEHEICVSKELSSVSKSHMEIIIQKMAKVLESQGISCFQCPKSRYKLFPLSNDWQEESISARENADCRFGMAILCGNDRQVYCFALTLSPIDNDTRRN